MIRLVGTSSHKYEEKEQPGKTPRSLLHRRAWQTVRADNKPDEKKKQRDISMDDYQGYGQRQARAFTTDSDGSDIDGFTISPGVNPNLKISDLKEEKKKKRQQQAAMKGRLPQQPDAKKVSKKRKDLYEAVPARTRPSKGAAGLRSAETDEKDLEELEKDEMTASSRSSANSRMDTVKKILGDRRLALTPVTRGKIRILMAKLKAEKYASANQYIGTYFAWAERRTNCKVSSRVKLLRRVWARSCVRNLGPVKQASESNLERMARATQAKIFHPAALVENGPIFPRESVIAVGGLVTREIEQSSLLEEDVLFIDNDFGNSAASSA